MKTPVIGKSLLTTDRIVDDEEDVQNVQDSALTQVVNCYGGKTAFFSTLTTYLMRKCNL